MKCYECGTDTDPGSPGTHVVGDFARCLTCRIGDLRESYAHGSGQGGAYADDARKQFDEIIDGVRAKAKADALRRFAGFLTRCHRPGLTSRNTVIADAEHFATQHERNDP